MYLPFSTSLLIALNGIFGNLQFNETAIGEVNQFGVQVLQDLLQNGSNENGTLVSAFGLANGLALCSAGASGYTRQLLHNRLPFLAALENSTHQQLNQKEYENELRESYDYEDQYEGYPTVHMLNRVVVMDPALNLQLEADYVDHIRKHFQASVRRQAMHEKPEEITAELNKWAADNTNGSIQKLVGELPLNPPLHLLNALTFDGQWRSKFDREMTTQGEFTDENGTIHRVSFMNKDSLFRHAELNDYSALQMSYGSDDEATMLILLPKANVSIQQLLSGLNMNELEKINWQESGVYVSLPKFSLEVNLDMRSTLEKFGLSNIFTDAADFNSMSKGAGLKVASVKQSVQFTVDEDGTRAAAVTHIQMRPRGMSWERFEANRPFVYILNYGGVHLYTGAFLKPSKQE